MTSRKQRHTWRRDRKERREELETLGRTPARRQFIWRVETEVLAIPWWAFDKAEPDLGWSSEHVWLYDRILGFIICKMDRESGGHPKLDRFQVRHCQRCGMLRFGVLAEARRCLDESAVDGRDLPCSPECVLREQLQRGKYIPTTRPNPCEKAFQKGVFAV